MDWYPPYVPVGARRARARLEMRALRERGVEVQPVEVEGRGRAVARSFWGRRWCEHLESFSDYANRLPRGRTYVRNGCVCHLAIETGGVDALVAGRELYHVVIRIRKLKRPAWKAIQAACAGQIGSVLELLQGRLSDRVMEIVADRETGLFPQPGEIKLACDCPDWATMCKHAAAVLYGVGARLDKEHAHVPDAEEHRPLKRWPCELVFCPDIDVRSVVEEKLRDLTVLFQDRHVEGGCSLERHAWWNEYLVRVRPELHVLSDNLRVLLVDGVQERHAGRLGPAGDRCQHHHRKHAC